MRQLFVSAMAALAGAALNAADFKATDFGAVADGKTDCAAAIQGAIDAAGKAGGGRIIIPAARNPYLVGKTITVRASNIELEGRGATLLRAPRVVKTSRDNVLTVSGSPGRRITNVVVRGLAIDGNYWNQLDEKNGKKPQTRGLEVEHAGNVLVDRVQVRRAWVSLAFAAGTLDCEARDCAVSQWHNDGFDAANGADNIRFVRCRAHDAAHGHNGGLPGTRDGAWEIEDGAQNITLIECVVEQCEGGGIKVRSHAKPNADAPPVLRNIRFLRCRVAAPAGGWGIMSEDFAVRTDGVLLEDCEGNMLQCVNGAENVEISGGKFEAMTILYPRKMRVASAEVGLIMIWAKEIMRGNRSFRPRIILDGVKARDVPVIVGDKSMVTLRGGVDYYAAIYGPDVGKPVRQYYELLLDKGLGPALERPPPKPRPGRPDLLRGMYPEPARKEARAILGRALALAKDGEMEAKVRQLQQAFAAADFKLKILDIYERKIAGAATPRPEDVMALSEAVAELETLNNASPAAHSGDNLFPGSVEKMVGIDYRRIGLPSREMADYLVARHIKGAPAKLTCVAAAKAPAIDGKLNDECWANAPQAALVGKDNNKPPDVATRVSAAYDQTNLYIVFFCEEPEMDRLADKVAGRDGPAWEDNEVEIFLDTNSDRRTCFQFVINSSGALADIQIKEGAADLAWNAASRVATAQNEDSYVIEWSVPFGELGLARPPGAGDAWLANFCRARRIGDAREYSCFTPTFGPFYGPHFFGRLEFGN